MPDDNHPQTAFISGPIDVSQDYFQQYYLRPIQQAIQSGHHFVVGPVGGIDALALEHLRSSGIPLSRTRIFMAGFEVAARPDFVSQLRSEGIDVVEARTSTDGSARSTWDRDAAMTRASDYDILRFRTERECKALYGALWRPRVSNTERNWRRRRGEEGCEKWGIGYIAHREGGEGGAWKDVLGLRGEQGEEDRCDGSCDGHRQA